MRLNLNPRPGREFSITRPGGGGGRGRCNPPGVSKLSVVALREKKNIDCSQRVFEIGGIFFDTGSTFGLVMTGQRSIIGEIDVFSTLQDNSDGAMANIAIELLPSCLVDN